MKETTSDGRGQFRQTLTAEPQRTRITVRPPIIPGEFEPHPAPETSEKWIQENWPHIVGAARFQDWVQLKSLIAECWHEGYKAAWTLDNHPDTRRLDWLLREARTYGIGVGRDIRYILCLDRPYYIAKANSGDPRDIIDRAMEGEDE
jgi:hypothetical protein